MRHIIFQLSLTNHLTNLLSLPLLASSNLLSSTQIVRFKVAHIKRSIRPPTVAVRSASLKNMVEAGFRKQVVERNHKKSSTRQNFHVVAGQSLGHGGRFHDVPNIYQKWSRWRPLDFGVMIQLVNPGKRTLRRRPEGSLTSTNSLSKLFQVWWPMHSYCTEQIEQHHINHI